MILEQNDSLIEVSNIWILANFREFLKKTQYLINTLYLKEKLEIIYLKEEIGPVYLKEKIGLVYFKMR